MWICNISLYRQRVNLCFARRTKIERHASLHSREISRKGRKDKTRNRRRRDWDDVGEVESFRDTSDISVRQFASRSANDAHYLCNGVFRLFDSLSSRDQIVAEWISPVLRNCFFFSLSLSWKEMSTCENITSKVMDRGISKEMCVIPLYFVLKL